MLEKEQIDQKMQNQIQQKLVKKPPNKLNKMREKLKMQNNLSQQIKNNYTIKTQVQNQIETNDDKFFQKYNLEKKIGEGTTAVVKECSLKSSSDSDLNIKLVNKQMVVKIMKYRDIEYYFEILRELILIQQLKHNNIVQYIDSYVNNTTKNIYLVLEKAQGETLTNYLKFKQKLSEEEAAHIMEKIFFALDYFDSKNICHRDLTLDNIIYDPIQKQIKIIDFSVSKEIKNSNIKMWTQTGKIQYLAPEIFSLDYNRKIDIWSAGIVMFTLLMGYFPFSNPQDSDLNVQRNILKKKLDIDEQLLSDNAKDLIYKLLEKNPKKRISISDAINHEWFNAQKKLRLSQKIPIYCKIKQSKLQEKNNQNIGFFLKKQFSNNFDQKPKSSQNLDTFHTLKQQTKSNYNRKKKKSTQYICQSFSTINQLQNEDDQKYLLLDSETPQVASPVENKQQNFNFGNEYEGNSSSQNSEQQSPIKYTKKQKQLSNFQNEQ